MRVARRCFLPTLLAVVATCVGCDQHPAEGTSKQSPRDREEPPPEVKRENPTKPFVELTPRAARKVKEIVESHGVTGTWALRLEASWQKGVCCPQHRLDLDTNLSSAEDHVFDSGGFKLVVLKRQVEMFRGAQIDYGEKGGEKGFLVNNPNFEGELLKKWGPIVAADPLSKSK
jgi:Fe-S cluster assembly iron-binding protein IscA